MLPEGAADLEDSIGFASSAGAVVLALERIAKEQLLPDIEWRCAFACNTNDALLLLCCSFVWYHPECSEPMALGSTISLILGDKIDVIIGPPCSICALDLPG